MIYDLLRPLTRIAFYAFFHRIYLSGKENIPKNGPVIFTPNHPTAFIEPCFIACFSGRRIHFMTRGDVFTHKWIRWLLKQVHLIPIYRFRDGYANLKRNETSFLEGKRVLAKKEALLIMAEGGMRHEKRLRPIQKGAARIAFEAMEEFELPELFIQPVGVNYTYAHLARSEMMIAFAPPLRMSTYWALYRARPKEAIEAVTKDIEQLLKASVIHIEDPNDDILAEWLFDAHRTDSQRYIRGQVLIQDEGTLHSEWEIAQHLNALSETEKSNLKVLGESYRNLLKQNNLSDKAVNPEGKRELSYLKLRGIIRILNLCLLIPNVLPIILARVLTKWTVTSIEFRSSILMGLLMFLWMGWYISVVLFLGWLVSGMAGIIAAFMLPLSLYLYVKTLSFLEATSRLSRWESLSKEEKETTRNARRSFLDYWTAIRYNS